MDTWKFQLAVVAFCALVQTYQGLSGCAEEERGLSKDWQDEPLETVLTNPVDSLIKRSKALRFYGLMGKRSGCLNSIPKYKAKTVLLKCFLFITESLTRIVPSATTTAIHVSEKPHKQGMIVSV
uniref:Uncharacterized protein n=1 Tax=Stegastes partitus TaxID=144197 RepID=A0A3B5AQL6_9TELE